MSDYRLSRRAVVDLEAIAEFSIDRFGIQQARRYRNDLTECFQRIANTPEIGRRAEQLAKGLRRIEIGSHVVFYLPTADGALTVRVLHYRMDAGRHL